MQMVMEETAAGRWSVADAAEVCETHAGVVYRFARMVARSEADAEDLAHDALVKVIRGHHRFNPDRGELSAWLWRVVLNAARDRSRVATRRHLLLEKLRDLTRAESQPHVEEAAIAGMADADLVAAIRGLPARARTLIALRYGADLDFEAVGRQMGISAAGARMAHARALAQLRGGLQEVIR